MGLHGDVDVACATLSPAWPLPSLTFPTFSPRIFAVSSAGSIRAASRRRRMRTSRIPATTSGGCSHDAGFTPRLFAPTEQFALLDLGYGDHERRLPDDAGLGRSASRRLRRGAARRVRPASSGRSRSPSSARRPTAARSASAPSSGRSCARSARPPSSSSRRPRPRMPPCPTPTGCSWFRALRAWLEPVPREAVRALVVDAEERVLLLRFENPVTHDVWWATPGGGVEAGESDELALRRELLEEMRPRAARAGPGRLDARARLSLGPRSCSRQARALPPRPRRPARRRADDRPRRRGRLRAPLVDARRAGGDRRALAPRALGRSCDGSCRRAACRAARRSV